MILNDKELKKIQGGFKITVGILISGIVTFLIGLFDGYVRPLACN